MEGSTRKDSQDISQTVTSKKGGRKFETNEDDLKKDIGKYSYPPDDHDNVSEWFRRITVPEE